MLQTISIGNHISVQGYFVAQQADGRVAVRVNDRIYLDQPVTAKPQQ